MNGLLQHERRKRVRESTEATMKVAAESKRANRTDSLLCIYLWGTLADSLLRAVIEKETELRPLVC